MNRKSADRIIVKSNERMKLVIDWYMDNRNWIDRENFKAPMESGVVELQEEMLEFTFENIGDIVEIAIYPTLEPNIPASIIFDYKPMTQRITNRRVAPTLPEAKRQALNLVMLYDRTDQKEALKYHALMQFMVYYREAVEIEERSVKPTPKAKSHKRKVRRKPQPLIRRAYIINEFGSAAFKKPDGGETPLHQARTRGKCSGIYAPIQNRQSSLGQTLCEVQRQDRQPQRIRIMRRINYGCWTYYCDCNRDGSPVREIPR